MKLSELSAQSGSAEAPRSLTAILSSTSAIMCDKRRPVDLGANGVRDYFGYLALEKVTASTQNVALAALLSLYKGVSHKELENIADVVRKDKPRRSPVVVLSWGGRGVGRSLHNKHLSASLVVLHVNGPKAAQVVA